MYNGNVDNRNINSGGVMKIDYIAALIVAGKNYCHQKTNKIVTNADNMISVYLLYNDAVSQENIAQALGYDKTTVAKALNKLEDLGLITRKLNPSNRRENIISLTEAGIESARIINDIRMEWGEKISSCLTEEEEKEYDRLTFKLLSNAYGLLDEAYKPPVKGGNRRNIILSDDAPAPKGHYCQAIKHNGLLYLSGILGIDKSGEVITSGIAAEAEQIFNNLKAILKAGGSSIDKMIKVTIYISDMNEWPVVNKMYGELLGEHRCARSIVPVNKLHYGLNMELEAIAICD